MMNFETFLLLLMIVSVLTGLVTEGIKKLLDEAKKPYRSNLLAGVVAVILSIAGTIPERFKLCKERRYQPEHRTPCKRNC